MIVLSGGVENLQVRHQLPSGDRIVAWRELPTLGRWAAATLLWTGLGLAAVFAAASRHREGRGISFRAPERAPSRGDRPSRPATS